MAGIELQSNGKQPLITVDNRFDLVSFWFDAIPELRHLLLYSCQKAPLWILACLYASYTIDRDATLTLSDFFLLRLIWPSVFSCDCLITSHLPMSCLAVNKFAPFSARIGYHQGVSHSFLSRRTLFNGFAILVWPRIIAYRAVFE